jgi:quercetin dioxygenase-like cupin family protein
MKRFLACLTFLALTAGTVSAQDAAAPAAAAPTHTIVLPAGIQWGAPPPVFEKGMSFAVISGDPGKEGLYVVRAKLPAGYKINPHWHPTDEHVTVLSGTFAIGMGENFDAKTMTKLGVGGYVMLPAQMRHYAMATTAAVIQVHGMGPFALTYVHPEDDPSQRAAATK